MGSMRIKDLVVRERHYDPHVDGYLVVGHYKNQKKSLKNHVVGWVSRHNDVFHEDECFASKGAATRHFNQCAYNKRHWPADPSFKKDYQKEQLYKWQINALFPHALRIDEKQARSLIRKVSRDYGIRAPELVMEKEIDRSEYDNETNTIHFGNRDNISLLHELAHTIHDLKLHNEELLAHHSPGFVWIALELYNKYAGIDMHYLMLGAAQNDLLGDLDEQQLTYAESPHYQSVSRNAKKLQP